MIEKVLNFLTPILVALISIGALAYFGVLSYSEYYICKTNPEKCVCEESIFYCKERGYQVRVLDNKQECCNSNKCYYPAHSKCNQFRMKTETELEADYCNENPDDGTMCNIISEECYNIVRSEAGNWEVSVPIEERFCKDICSKSKRTKSCEEFFTEHNLSLYGTIKELHEKELTLIGFCNMKTAEEFYYCESECLSNYYNDEVEEYGWKVGFFYNSTKCFNKVAIPKTECEKGNPDFVWIQADKWMINGTWINPKSGTCRQKTEVEKLSEKECWWLAGKLYSLGDGFRSGQKEDLKESYALRGCQ